MVDELESIVVDVLPQLPKLNLLLESPRVDGSEGKQPAFSAGSSVLLISQGGCRHGRFDCLRDFENSDALKQTGVVEAQYHCELAPESMHEELKTKLGQSEKQVVIRTETDADIFVPVRAIPF